MFCEKCGAARTGSELFCSKCGNQLPAQAPPPVTSIYGKPKKPKTAVFLAAGLGVAVSAVVFFVLFHFGVIGGGGNSSGGRVEGPGYSSPEEAAKAYLDALSNADVNAMISTFAIETFSKNVDFAASLEETPFYNYFIIPSVPSSNHFTTDLSTQQRLADVANSIRSQYLSFFAPHILNEARPVVLESEDPEREAQVIVDDLGNAEYLQSLRSLKVIEFVPPESLYEYYSEEVVQQRIDRQRDIIGADRLENIVARVEIDGEIYLFCFDVAHYGGRWYLHTLGGHIALALGFSYFNAGVIPEDELSDLN